MNIREKSKFFDGEARFIRCSYAGQIHRTIMRHDKERKRANVYENNEKRGRERLMSTANCLNVPFFHGILSERNVFYRFLSMPHYRGTYD